MNELNLKCPECDFVESNDNNFIDTKIYCEECGEHVAIQCPKCGLIIDGAYNSKACLKCGLIRYKDKYCDCYKNSSSGIAELVEWWLLKHHDL